MLLSRRICRHALVSAAALALAAPAACGEAERPPLNGATRPRDAGADSASQSFVSTTPTELSCNLGPDGGVCACADEPLLGDPPNLYFVLDRSGSMQEDGKWATIVSAIGSLVVDLGPRAVVGAAVFPDPRYDECAPGVEVAPLRRGDSPAGTAGPTAVAFITELGGLPASGGTPTATTLETLAPTLAKLPGKTYVILATDGGPNCDATASCGVSDCELNIEGATGSACAPDTTHNCCADPNYGSSLSCLDAQPTIDAVTAIAQSGVPVYVVGVPGSAPYAALLDQLAQAGGTARSSEPLYYAVNTAALADFTAAISSIAAGITGTCTLTLDDAPPDPTNVNVFLDEKVLPQSGADGWTLSGKTVTILGPELPGDPHRRGPRCPRRRRVSDPLSVNDWRQVTARTRIADGARGVACRLLGPPHADRPREAEPHLARRLIADARFTQPDVEVEALASAPDSADERRPRRDAGNPLVLDEDLADRAQRVLERALEDDPLDQSRCRVPRVSWIQLLAWTMRPSQRCDTMTIARRAEAIDPVDLRQQRPELDRRARPGARSLQRPGHDEELEQRVGLEETHPRLAGQGIDADVVLEVGHELPAAREAEVQHRRGRDEVVARAHASTS